MNQKGENYSNGEEYGKEYLTYDEYLTYGPEAYVNQLHDKPAPKSQAGGQASRYELEYIDNPHYHASGYNRQESLLERRLAEAQTAYQIYQEKHPDVINNPWESIVRGLEDGTIIPQN